MTVTPSDSSVITIAPESYRSVLGQYPTGVCVVTADSPDDGPSGMVVGSFTSVSLDPPLIAFYPAKSSTSWPKIEAAGSFCVNILAADQEEICRIFSAKTADKFVGVRHHPTPETGSPIIDDVVAWIDCDIELVQDAGDHVLVLGRVRQLDIEAPRLPLLFFQGGYGRFSPHSLATADPTGSMTTPLWQVDLIRPLLERLAEGESCRCLVGALVGDDVFIVASAGQAQDDEVNTASLVGQRLPYLPPSGSVFAAWASEAEQEHWLQQSDAASRDHHRAALGVVRQRGYSLGLISSAQREFASTLQAMAQRPGNSFHTSLFGLIPQLSYDPLALDADVVTQVRQISAPVFAADASVALALTVFGYLAPERGAEKLISVLLDTAAEATRRIGGVAPGDLQPA
ncbi:flavin reductase [uncultured Jatrophihabitans sp.]|uniref:flavin reductase n=1 Tax=uncultured Jatrophihabitans sp. TaxID=1610747 RepID=UPI0035CAC919